MRQRTASETPEERETSLQRMQQRLASETPERREEGHQLDREWHRQQREINALPSLLQQPAVHSKMTAFHSTIGALQVSYCITCFERFPGLNVRAISPSNDSMECVHCKQDRHIPKMYSSENSMDPAPVPPELCIIFYLGSTFDAKQYIIISILFVVQSTFHGSNTFLQGLTQVEEMLISAVMPIMCIYHLPHEQKYGYSGHVINHVISGHFVNLPQDVLSFASTLPRLPSKVDTIVVRKERANATAHAQHTCTSCGWAYV